MNDTRTLHYVPSSHWDREWYLPFQKFRHLLVKLLDDLLDAFRDGRISGPFTCDGQVILVEDYLEIRPERRAEILQHLKDGRLVLGPWYVLPDEFLVSGESLVRNLRFGRDLVRKMGGRPSDAGFLCDLFGHNSQMPQILAGFGIKGALVWRGVDSQIGAQFDWIGADGTTILTYRFGRRGYCDYTYKVRRSNEQETVFEPRQAEEDLAAFCSEELERSGGNSPGLIFDGGDHLQIDWDHYSVVRAMEEMPRRDWKIEHSTLDRFLSAMSNSEVVDRPSLRGELREPARWPVSEDTQFLIPGCGSSRVWIKLQNAECEALLCGWVEPFAAFTHFVLGLEHPDAYLRLAWKSLLENHPHDSICGCSVDQVHEDMKYRFSQCKQIGESLLQESLFALARAAPGELGEYERRIVLFNPLTRPRESEVVEFEVEIPINWPEFTEFFAYELKPAFRLIEEKSGREVVYHRISTRRAQTRTRLSPLKYPDVFTVHVVQVAAKIDLPALGFTSLRIVGNTPNGAHGDHLGNRGVLPTRHRVSPGLRSGSTSMENEHLSVTLDPNGTLAIYEKASGRAFHGLNSFESDADIGDGWYHGPILNQRDMVGGSFPTRIELLADTPLMTRFMVYREIAVPQAFDSANAARSSDYSPLVIESVVTLRAGAAWVDIVTRVKNAARDHRLRAIFPTGINAQRYFADSPFDVVERPISLRPDNHLFRELEVETKPQQTWTALFEEGNGFAVVTAGGLMESTVIDRLDRPIAITLFRATGRTKNANGEVNGQLLNMPLEFRYRILPLAGSLDRVDLFSHARDLACGIKGVFVDRQHLKDRAAVLSHSEGLLSCQGNFVETSIRAEENGLELRGFNPTEDHGCLKVEFSSRLHRKRSLRVDLEGGEIGASLVGDSMNGV
ncbi:MAG: glycoside hydrolase family 38 C-terminal domain-containing protein [Puniceicoccaceae bacterium]